VDEAGVSEDPVMGKTWAPRGHTPTIRANFGWEKVTAISGIDLQGEICFKVIEGSVYAPDVVDYLEQLVRHIDGFIVILWDGLPAHKASCIKEFEETFKEKIAIFRLPAYCPDFNPMEWFWAYVKWDKMKSFCPKNISELKTKLRKIVNGMRRQPDLIQAFFELCSLPLLDEVSK
jgi:transposase